MPIYEYVCAKCGHELEALQKVSDAPLSECPNCHRASLSKKISAPPFHLKGTGWYATDFRDKGKKKDSKQDSEGQDSSKSEDKSESKSAESKSKDTTTKDNTSTTE